MGLVVFHQAPQEGRDFPDRPAQRESRGSQARAGHPDPAAWTEDLETKDFRVQPEPRAHEDSQDRWVARVCMHCNSCTDQHCEHRAL